MNFFNGTIEEGVFRSDDLEIELDGYQWAGGASFGEAWLGIRPEHVVSDNSASRMPYSTEIEVELFEPMGSDTLMWTFIGDQSFNFRLDGQIKVSDGDRLAIGFDIRRGSIFDKKFIYRL